MKFHLIEPNERVNLVWLLGRRMDVLHEDIEHLSPLRWIRRPIHFDELGPYRPMMRLTQKLANSLWPAVQPSGNFTLRFVL